MRLPVVPPVAPMLARAVMVIPPAAAGEMWFEPKWDGFRAVVFRDGPAVEIGSRNERPLTRYFPELAAPLRARLPERCVLDGELVIRGADGGLDFDALSARIHPAASRIAKLAEETPALFVAFDILALGDRDLRPQPFVERRRILTGVAAGFGPPVHLTPATTDRSVADDWFERFAGAGLDGIIAKPAADPYQPGQRAQFKLKQRHTAECVVAGYRLHRSGDGVGSLLLGLHDGAGVLHYVGAASGFKAKQRAELANFLAPHHAANPSTHPWLTAEAAGVAGATDNSGVCTAAGDSGTDAGVGGSETHSGDGVSGAGNTSGATNRVGSGSDTATVSGSDGGDGNDESRGSRDGAGADSDSGDRAGAGRNGEAGDNRASSGKQRQRAPQRLPGSPRGSRALEAPSSVGRQRAPQRLPGSPNRWRSGDAAWVPLHGAPVAEVVYDAVLSGRFRHSPRFSRWRPDRDPRSCTYDQIARTPPLELAEIFASANPS